MKSIRICYGHYLVLFSLKNCWKILSTEVWKITFAAYGKHIKAVEEVNFILPNLTLIQQIRLLIKLILLKMVTLLGMWAA